MNNEIRNKAIEDKNIVNNGRGGGEGIYNNKTNSRTHIMPKHKIKPKHTGTETQNTKHKTQVPQST